ncbi:MAG TPA: oxygen-independent coproporphyrinogen III oxidase [Rhodanobacteraceae bacterium]
MASTSAPEPAAGLRFDPALIRKYDGFGPRYTSYPTADRFHAGYTAADYVDALASRDAAQPLSLYVHLPFCNTICYYCACNKIITANRSRSAKYVRYVANEIDIVSSLLGGARGVQQLHWGGGTPTFLAHEEMAVLTSALRNAFEFAEDAEVSIEVDPRKVDVQTVAMLRELGFNRMSLGIQDFDPAVQKAVNRIQTEAETRSVIEAARKHGFRSINADLIYGLPRQTVTGFSATLDKVLDLAPDRVALYGYAHVPHLFKAQRQIVVHELPAADTKLAILQTAIERLTAAGYQYIGMDHFARPDDELAVAQRNGKLHRNFQGYSTRPDCDLLAFGISAIGKLGTSYVQNVRTLDGYYAALDERRLPVMRGYTLDADDRLRRDIIQKLMCEFRLDFASFERQYGLRFEDGFATELAALDAMIGDGLVRRSADGIDVTPRGRMLVRSVAMVFDRHLREARERARYSRVI